MLNVVFVNAVVLLVVVMLSVTKQNVVLVIIVMLSIVMLNAPLLFLVMLSVIILNVVLTIAVILNVVAPTERSDTSFGQHYSPMHFNNNKTFFPQKCTKHGKAATNILFFQSNLRQINMSLLCLTCL